MTEPPRPLVGRPRGFDADDALERAMLVFWEKGYAGASLDELTGAMGITRNSLYRAFGSKEELFLKALERYDQGPAAYGRRAVAEPTAEQVVVAFLNGAVQASTRAGSPRGCLGVQGALAVGEPDCGAQQALSAWRNSGRTLLRDRFQLAIEAGDLPEGTDPQRLAGYVMTVAFGIAVQAASGLSREELQEIADTALSGWSLQANPLPVRPGRRPARSRAGNAARTED